MDPLSAIASVTGLLAAIAKVSTTVNGIAKKMGNAPDSIHSLVNEISDLSVCLVQLQPFVRGTQSPASSRAAAISVEQVVAIITSCVLNMSKLEEIIDTLQSRQPLTLRDKITLGTSWAKRETEINNLMLRIRASSRSLNLILTIFNCKTSEEVQESVHSLTMMVQSLLENSEAVSSRLANLEEKLARTAVTADGNAELQSVFESLSTTASTPALNTYQQSAIEAQESPTAASEAASELDPCVQRILQESRVYSRTLPRSTSPWSYRSGDGWSMLSSISLAQIYNISVLSIPILASEVWGADHYVDPSVLVPSRSDGTLVNRRLRTQKLSEIIPHRSAGISQGIRRLISPFFLDSDEARRLKEARRPKGARRNNEIDLLIRSETYKPGRLLLLGTGESGKSTMLKQMRMILSKEGFEWEERKRIRQLLFSNMRVAFKIILEEMYASRLELNCQTSVEYAALLDAVDDIGLDDPFPKACLAAIEGLWDEAGFQDTIRRGNQFALHDNLHYCFENRLRFFSEDYVPTDEDVLHARLRTSGILDTLLDFPRAGQYHVFDVEGERSGRKKWVHVFNETNCLIFVVPLSAYDSCLVEDKTGIIMKEALLLFETLMSLQWFKYSTIVLMLNKLDLFKQKIAVAPIAEFWPDFTGGNDFYAALCYFTQKFLDLNREPRRFIHVLYTDATNKEAFVETLRRIDDVLVENLPSRPDSYKQDALLAAASTIDTAQVGLAM